VINSTEFKASFSSFTLLDLQFSNDKSHKEKIKKQLGL